MCGYGNTSWLPRGEYRSDFQGKILHFDDTIAVYFLFHNLRFSILMTINIAY